jgi:2-oxoisovalerate dehydrogenase E2 component (dihydrolipoyl transacylase)
MTERVWYSPAVRKLMQELGIDPRTVHGTGRNGRVTRNDMLCAAEARQQSSRPEGTRSSQQPATQPTQDSGLRTQDLIPLSRIRRMTAENLTRTVREVPMERLYVLVEWGALAAARAAMRARFEAEQGVPLTFMPFILRGMVLAARQAPRVNSRWTAAGPEIVPALNLGVAVSTDDGLQVPVVHHAEDLSVAGLTRVLHRIITAARESRLQIADIQGGTITVTNPGPFGTVLSMPIIPPGQSAIVSVDTVREVPFVRDGTMGIRAIANVGITYDARLCDDSDAMRFLITLKSYLEHDFTRELRA